MSYSIYIFHASVKDKVDSGLELDAFEHQPIEPSEVLSFIDRLALYGYKQDGQNTSEFVKKVDECPIQVTVFNSEIAFSIPYWEGSEDAIFEALQDASELADSDSIVMFDPQTEEWSNL